jgi:tetratricopeptide (TPR) repeat protein
MRRRMWPCFLPITLFAFPWPARLALQEEAPAPPWQRSLADAEVLSLESGRPLLLCMDQDGVPACDDLLAPRYLDPGFGELMRGFAAVIASPVRHRPRDHDREGRRLSCPRFLGVTCGEHLVAWEEVPERHLRGQRFAPRLLALAPRGPVLFDLYLEAELAGLEQALRTHGRARAPRDWAALLASRDSRDRERVEAAFLRGSRELRAELLRLAASAPSEPLDLLRLGIAERDPELRTLAARALAHHIVPASLPLLTQALRSALPDPERVLLLRCLAALAEEDAQARFEFGLQLGLARPSERVPLRLWLEALAQAGPPEPEPPPLEEEGLYARIDALGAELRLRPMDPALCLELARQSLAAAELRLSEGRDPELLLNDALELARRASQALGDPLAGAAVRAEAAWLAGRVEEAAEEASAAVGRGLERPLARDSRRLLALLALSRASQVLEAGARGETWPPEWLADALAAHEVLLHHPAEGPGAALVQAELLRRLGLLERELQALERAIARFPADPGLHAAWREALVEEGGMDSLPAAYARLLQSQPGAPILGWYAGYAELLAAEGSLREGEARAAREHYASARERLERCLELEPATTESSLRLLALSWAGEAWISLCEGAYGRSLEEILRSLRVHPDSADTTDGHGRSPAGVALLLRGLLQEAEEAELLLRLEAALEALPR